MKKEIKEAIIYMLIMSSVVVPITMLLWINMFACYGYEDSFLCLVK